MSNTPSGADCIKSAIKKNFWGGVSVNLKGVNKTYYISKSEIENAKHLSSGDEDVKAIELAVEHYRKEQIEEKMQLMSSKKSGFASITERKKLF